MAFAASITDGVSRWTESAAGTIVATLGRFASPRRVQLIEDNEGLFSIHVAGSETPRRERVRIEDGHIAGAVDPKLSDLLKGSRVEVLLRPSRFVFRPLQLPGQAANFLDGVVRSQIDRLTPWTTKDAVFGWSKGERANGRISVMIAATARVGVSSLIEAVAEYGAASIAIFTTSGDDAVRIKVLDHEARGMLDVRQLSRVLLIILVASGSAGSLAFAADLILGDYIQTQQLELSQHISGRRAAITSSQESDARSGSALLVRRKHEMPSTVIVLDVLSSVLPDHTYVTDLRIDGDKVQIIGITRDAPSLIGLMEQSPHFSRATFFAPTTRSSSDAGERFHIEAHLEPVNRS